ncbi:MAG: M20/M25/M40 family metallo-hydrolase [Eubacteriales bacterium]|nr:M20/M25/M40 family metallo-hydrolase [Eubacteriales bacterium]
MVDKIWNECIEKETIEILQDLVRIRTINSHNNEIIAVHYLSHIFEREGIDYKIIESAPGRGNIIARLKGGSKEPMLFISHLDVVDVDATKWDKDPFAGLIEDGHIIGRGTLDTKQLTVMALMSLLQIKRNNIELDRDIIFIATADEENGSKYGMQYLMENHKDLIPNGFVINEGGGFILPNLDKTFRICACGEKGVCEIAINLPGGKDFFKRLNEIIARVTSYESGEVMCAVSTIFMQTTGDLINQDETIKNLWEYMTHNTFTLNAFDFSLKNFEPETPNEIKATFRFLPIMAKDDVIKTLDKVFEGLNVEYAITKYFDGYESDLDNDFIRLLEEQSNFYDKDATLLPMIALGNTDGRFIRHNVYGYSPLLASDSFDRVLKKVHLHNESITVASLVYGTKVLLGTTMAMLDSNRNGGIR